ncbi:CoA transferase [Kitasatospora sp. NBC_01287]|uniref:CaiB/BaiF CoA transferase family protein n=1 Tax=Kitasatospora sp. NBC_01287 TaxID=2903573 RepID=UPI00225C1BEE|nr:CaiB/BaiF CoA-transferase family protein [Kitasatospora sp. NBC_01287]MCX4745756.1 CoA transferase [Kitasatospora sp. NBC_01287]
MSLPLTGVTVVALEQAVAAPLATRHLADLGARVVKVERPDGGDFAREYDRSVGGLASHFVWLNRGKESITLDLKTPGGRAVLADLVASADVFVQNLSPGAAARLGFGARELRERQPGLVTVDLSGYGSGGPYQDKRAYDMLIQCETGLASVTGSPERPAKTGVPTSDIAAGMYALTGTLAALVGRAATGLGSAVEISMFEATAEWLGHQLHHTQGTGVQPERAGLSHPGIAPYDAYPTADGHELLIGIQNDREWARFADGFLGRPELADDPQWATNVARVRRRRLVDALVAGRTATMTAAEAVKRLDELAIASARLNDVTDLLRHPQLAARDRWRPVATPVGEVRGLLPPFGFAGVELPMGPVPALGEQTEPVLRSLGYPPERIAALRAAGALGGRGAPAA